MRSMRIGEADLGDGPWAGRSRFDPALRQYRPAGDHRHAGDRPERHRRYISTRWSGTHRAAHHRMFALSLKDGAPLPGWPVDIAEALAARGQRFNTRYQNQRGALAILDGRVYVPMADITAIAAIIVAGSSGFACRTLAISSAGAPAGGAAASGRRAGSAATAASLFVATGNTSRARHGAMARRCSG